MADLEEMIRAGGYSQSAVANVLGVPRQRVSEWLKGISKPSLQTGLAIAEHVRLWKRRQKRRAKRAAARVKILRQGAEERTAERSWYD
jgi:DNA-binding XRE family transcriptional regulator